jgi:hypothetical protein
MKDESLGNSEILSCSSKVYCSSYRVCLLKYDGKQYAMIIGILLCNVVNSSFIWKKLLDNYYIAANRKQTSTFSIEQYNSSHQANSQNVNINEERKIKNRYFIALLKYEIRNFLPMTSVEKTLCYLGINFFIKNHRN